MEKQSNLTVRLSEQVNKEETANLRAYVVNSEGIIIESAPFRGYEAPLRTSREDLGGRGKIYIATALPENVEASKLSEQILVKAGAYNVIKNFNGNYLDVLRVPANVLRPFPFYNCLVKGNVNKNFVIDGRTQNLPLCDLRVHICEVETEFVWPHWPLSYRRIPDWVLQELAGKIRELTVARESVVAAPQVSNRAPLTRQMKLSRPLETLTFSASRKAIAKATDRVAALPKQVSDAFLTADVSSIRKAIIDYHDLLYPYFCLWPVYWPWLYTCANETVVTTDCNGNFELWKNTFFEDGPLNVYIWVEAFIGGSWQTVYRPPIPCHTRWNYKCNTNINVTVSDPRLTPCDCGAHGPADAVWFRSIGQSASALHIEQNTGSTIALQGAILENGGCTDIITGQKLSPFGSTLTFKLFCGANIFAAGVTHYRWKKTRVTDANQNPVSESTSFVSGNVFRPYLVKLSATHYETHYCALGAEGSASDFAYRLPHNDVLSEPVSSLQDAADSGRSPEWTGIFFDSATIDSHSLTDGIWKFELELLKQTGGSFTPVAVNKQVFQVSQAGNIDNSTDAPNDYLNVAGGLATSFRMNLRIDNAACTGDIRDAQLAETGALSGPCGFIRYDHTAQHVHLSFEASHPRNFASFHFDVVKGNNTVDTGIHPDGYVLSDVNGFVMSGGIFSKDFTVQELLNGCPGQAAFSEALHVAALATDGTDRLYGLDYFDTITGANRNYDAYDNNAFALSNT